ncbi:MAG: hypothetical protein ACKVP5_16960 [Aestuariivirga sp.]
MYDRNVTFDFTGEIMELSCVTFMGPTVDDGAILDQLPENLRNLLKQTNGFILNGGALHVRGACRSPLWHSLGAAWNGEAAFHRIYPSVDANWIPFAEDCVGDQFFIADGKVLYLKAETGEVDATTMTLRQFLDAAEKDPIHALKAEPLLRFRQEKGDLSEGKLIMAYPPFCTKEAENGVSLAAMDAWELHRFHALLASKLPPDSSKLEVVVTEQ